MALAVKIQTAKAGDIRDVGSNPGSGRPPGGGHGNPLQYSCWENPMDRGAMASYADSDMTEHMYIHAHFISQTLL